MKKGCGLCARYGHGCQYHPDEPRDAAHPKKGLKQSQRESAQDRFLAAFAETATITAAAEVADVGRRTHYDWMADPEYAARFADAEQEAVDALEAEARRRAVVGVEEPVGWYQGVPGEYVRKYSDTLLIFLLKGAKPEKYRERFEHSGPGGVPLQPVDRVEVVLVGANSSG